MTILQRILMKMEWNGNFPVGKTIEVSTDLGHPAFLTQNVAIAEFICGDAFRYICEPHCLVPPL